MDYYEKERSYYEKEMGSHENWTTRTGDGLGRVLAKDCCCAVTPGKIWMSGKKEELIGIP